MLDKCKMYLQNVQFHPDYGIMQLNALDFRKSNEDGALFDSPRTD